MNDQCVIVTSNFAKWLRDLFPDRTLPTSMVMASLIIRDLVLVAGAL